MINLNRLFKNLSTNEITPPKHKCNNPRYTKIKNVGKGIFGEVFLVGDLKNRKYVALKEVEIKKETIRHLCRELICLKNVNHPNFLCLLDVFVSTKSNTVCFVVEYAERTLLDVINHKEFKMTQENISFVMYQLFCGINHLHKIGIIHRDLKSENVGVTKGIQIKILDFGLSRHTSEKMSMQLGSKAYSSPEVLSRKVDYTGKVDMWSIGCIFSEMIIRDVPDFRNEPVLNQFWTEPFLTQLKNKTFDWKEKFPDDLFCRYTDYNRPSVINQINATSARDLLSKLIVFDPNQRLSAFAATFHSYVSLYWDKDEITRTAKPLFTHSTREPTKKDLYNLVNEFSTEL